jgi:hypothetical protein
MSKQNKKLPGNSYLCKVERVIPTGPKCDHSRGQWIALVDGQYYSIQPNNNLTMHFWVREAGEQLGGEEQARACLRWLCHQCGTIQEP